MTLEKRFQVGHSVSFTHIYIIYHSSDSSGSYIYIYIHIFEFDPICNKERTRWRWTFQKPGFQVLKFEISKTNNPCSQRPSMQLMASLRASSVPCAWRCGGGVQARHVSWGLLLGCKPLENATWLQKWHSKKLPFHNLAKGTPWKEINRLRFDACIQHGHSGTWNRRDMIEQSSRATKTQDSIQLESLVENPMESSDVFLTLVLRSLDQAGLVMLTICGHIETWDLDFVINIIFVIT